MAQLGYEIVHGNVLVHDGRVLRHPADIGEIVRQNRRLIDAALERPRTSVWLLLLGEEREVLAPGASLHQPYTSRGDLRSRFHPGWEAVLATGLVPELRIGGPVKDAPTGVYLMAKKP